jgi:hypothetical protein
MLQKLNEEITAAAIATAIITAITEFDILPELDVDVTSWPDGSEGALEVKSTEGLRVRNQNVEALLKQTNELLQNMQDILTVQVSKLEDMDVSIDGNTAMVAQTAGGSISGADIEAAQTTYGRAAPLSITTTKKDTPEKAPEKEDLKENKRSEIDYCDLEKVVIEELKTVLLEFYNDVKR